MKIMLSRLIKPYVLEENLHEIIADYELKNWRLFTIEQIKAKSYYLEFEYGN